MLAGKRNFTISSNNTIGADRDLVERLINSDQAAFCELYAKYKKQLLYYTMRFIKSNELAEDIYQDAFTAVWQNRQFLDPERSFSSYLYTIVKNRALNALRDIENDQQLKSHILANSLDYSDNLEQRIQSNELRDIIEKAVKELTPRQRQIFEMSRNDQMSHKEIAESLGISIFTVQEHVSLAIKSIKTFFKNYPGYLTALSAMCWFL